MLLKRTITAFCALPIVIFAIIKLPQMYFLLLLLTFLIIAILESQKIFLSREGIFEKISFAVFTLLIVLFVYENSFSSYLSILLMVFFGYFLFRNLAINRPGTTIGRKTIRRNFNNLVMILFFSSYLGITFAFLMRIRNLPQGPCWILILLALSWGGDTGGYFVGKFGRKFFSDRLFPIVSPNKTWIGAFGSVVLALLFVFLFAKIGGLELSKQQLIFIAVFGNIISQLGDLFESFIKRAYRIKDSGSIIPGHGGILDRLDGVLFTAPFLYVYLNKIVYSL